MRQAGLELDRLRYAVRLCHEIELLSQKQHRHAPGLLAQVGKLLGTWISERTGKLAVPVRGDIKGVHR